MIPDETPTLKELPARERILRTAHERFYSDGIRATGIDRLIADSGVTKVTFYRHFPSKNDLILAYLDYRHARWMAWFTDALRRHGPGSGALVPALGEWLRDRGYRGCAFINSVGELGGALPEVLAVCRRHKDDMAAAIAGLLPPGREGDALALAMAVDGAIVQAQCTPTPEPALQALRRVVDSLQETGG